MNLEAKHTEELLSGYLDGELTQQQRQRVELHCEVCSRCRTELAGLRDVRERVRDAVLSPLGEDNWRETMNDNTVKASRGLGWLLVIGGLLAIGSIGVYEFVTDPSIETHMKIIVGAIYGGGTLLFLSVLRQRLIERRTDRYKDVEI
jgi:predicted anti-sigma-YlaC factor YlaD